MTGRVGNTRSYWGGIGLSGLLRGAQRLMVNDALTMTREATGRWVVCMARKPLQGGFYMARVAARGIAHMCQGQSGGIFQFSN